MSATKKLKASEKQAVVKKLTTLLKKEYGGSLPKANRPVLETVLFAICLERSGYDDAQAAYDRLLEAFFDLNEIRVSSVSEIEQALGELDDAAWKALRIRETLQYVFEKYYQFDFDGLRRKTLDAAQKQLEEINHITPFVQGYVLQQCLGAHVVPLDSGSRDALVWMGLVDPETDVQHAADEMKSALRKADGPLFSHLLHCLAVDRRRNGAFEPAEVAQNGSSADPETGSRPAEEPSREGLPPQEGRQVPQEAGDEDDGDPEEGGQGSSQEGREEEGQQAEGENPDAVAESRQVVTAAGGPSPSLL